MRHLACPYRHPSHGADPLGNFPLSCEALARAFPYSSPPKNFLRRDWPSLVQFSPLTIHLASDLMLQPLVFFIITTVLGFILLSSLSHDRLPSDLAVDLRRHC